MYLFVKVNNFSFFLTTVYARPYLEYKHALRCNFNSFYQVYNGPWLTFGDFNDITSANEKFGGKKVNLKCMHDFNCLINDCNLIDLGFTRPRFTWSNCRKDNIILERLDHFTANPLWLTNFPKTIVTHLPWTYSDHYLLILNLNPNHVSSIKSFKLEAMWLNLPSFDSLVHTIGHHILLIIQCQLTN